MHSTTTNRTAWEPALSRSSSSSELSAGCKASQGLASCSRLAGDDWRRKSASMPTQYNSIRWMSINCIVCQLIIVQCNWMYLTTDYESPFPAHDLVVEPTGSATLVHPQPPCIHVHCQNAALPHVHWEEHCGRCCTQSLSHSAMRKNVQAAPGSWQGSLARLEILLCVHPCGVALQYGIRAMQSMTISYN